MIAKVATYAASLYEIVSRAFAGLSDALPGVLDYCFEIILLALIAHVLFSAAIWLARKVLCFATHVLRDAGYRGGTMIAILLLLAGLGAIAALLLVPLDVFGDLFSGEPGPIIEEGRADRLAGWAVVLATVGLLALVWGLVRYTIYGPSRFHSYDGDMAEASEYFRRPPLW